MQQSPVKVLTITGLSQLLAWYPFSAPWQALLLLPRLSKLHPWNCALQCVIVGCAFCQSMHRGRKACRPADVTLPVCWSSQLPPVTRHPMQLGDNRQDNQPHTLCRGTLRSGVYESHIPIQTRAIELMFCSWYYIERRISSRGRALLPLVWLLPTGLGIIGKLRTWQSWSKQALSLHPRRR